MQEKLLSFLSKKRISSDDISKSLRPRCWKWYLQDFKKQFSSNKTDTGVDTYKIYYHINLREHHDSTTRRTLEE